MKRINRYTHLMSVGIAGFLGCLDPAVAQDQMSRFEITPYAAYRMGGSFDEQDGAGRVEINDSGAEGILFNIAANPGAV